MDTEALGPESSFVSLTIFLETNCSYHVLRQSLIQPELILNLLGSENYLESSDLHLTSSGIIGIYHHEGSSLSLASQRVLSGFHGLRT